MSDVSIDLVGITDVAHCGNGAFDQTTQALMASITTVNFLERTDPIGQGLEMSADGGDTWQPLMSATHGCPPRPNRHGVIPGTYDIAVSVQVDGPRLYRSFVDPMGVALTTTASISQQ